MRLKRARKALMLLDIILLLITVVWTCCRIKSNIAIKPVREVSLEIAPEYKIISGKKLKAWPAGTEFPQGMAAYFYAAKPMVDVTPVIKLIGMENGNVHGMIQSQITVQAIDDKSRIYWSYPLKKIQEQIFTLTAGQGGQTASSSFTSDNILLDTSAAYALISEISNELQYEIGIFQLVLTSKVHIQGSVNETSIDKTINQVLPLSLDQVYFTIPKTEDTITLLPLIQNTDTSKHISLGILPIWIILFLGVLLYLLMFSPEGIKKSKEALEHKRFREWITEGRVEIKDRFTIQILNLEGLVDLAIDMDTRVIYDARVNRYYVLTENIVYIYDAVSSKALLDNRQQLGKLLLDRGLLQPEQLEIGLFYQKKIGSRLGESLIALGFIDETTLYSTLAAQQKKDYFELDPAKDGMDTSWLEKMSIEKARVLKALPLGQRADGNLVIACSEPSREGVQKALEETFGSEIHLVASRPSCIYEALNHLALQIDQEKEEIEYNREKPLSPLECLSEKEWEEFQLSYFRGNIMHELLLKAAGLADPMLCSQEMKQKPGNSSIVSHSIMNGEIAILMKGLDKVTQAMPWKSRQEKMIPELLDLLLKANYLTAESVEWITREAALQGVPFHKLMEKNYLVSTDTIKNANLLLDTLKSILHKPSLLVGK